MDIWIGTCWRVVDHARSFLDMEAFESEVFELYKAVLKADEIEELRGVTEDLALVQKNACVRDIAGKSELMATLADSNALREFVPTDYLLVRSILFDKTPSSNWPVLWHQDLSIAVKARLDLPAYGPWSVKEGSTHVQPPSSELEQMVTLRVHLDPTPRDNGALRVIKSSHLMGKLLTPMVSAAVEAGEEVVCACQPGDVLKMSLLILHSSSRAEIPGNRRVLHFEYAHRSCLHSDLEWCG